MEGNDKLNNSSNISPNKLTSQHDALNYHSHKLSSQKLEENVTPDKNDHMVALFRELWKEKSKSLLIK